MPGFFASKCLIASSTNVRFGISAAQWLQNVSSFTCATAGSIPANAMTAVPNISDKRFPGMVFSNRAGS